METPLDLPSRPPLHAGTLPPARRPAPHPTLAVRVGSATIGGGQPIVVQSMCATKTADVEATVVQANSWRPPGRESCGSPSIRPATRPPWRKFAAAPTANLSVDLQENYRLAAEVAPWVDKIRYNPGHLYHYERSLPWQDKVRFLVDMARVHGCALRVGVNCGSVDPEQQAKFAADDRTGPMLQSASDHCELLDRLGFVRYCVSLKDSDPAAVVDVNRRFARQRPDVPLTWA